MPSAPGCDNSGQRCRAAVLILEGETMGTLASTRKQRMTPKEKRQSLVEEKNRILSKLSDIELRRIDNRQKIIQEGMPENDFRGAVRTNNIACDKEKIELQKQAASIDSELCKMKHVKYLEKKNNYTQRKDMLAMHEVSKLQSLKNIECLLEDILIAIRSEW